MTSFDRLADLAEQLAPSLVGLNPQQAQARVEGEPGLLLRVGEATTPVTADYRSGRITAWTRDGVIVGALAG